MRNAFITFILTGMLLFAGQASAQISLVHVTNCGPAVFPGTSCPIPATTRGNLVVVGWQRAGDSNGATVINSVTDNTGGVYLEAGPSRAVDANTNSIVDLWYASNVAAGSTSVTVTPSTSGSNDIAVIWEFSGIANAAPVDAVSVLNSQPASTTTTGAPATTTAASEVAIALMCVANEVTGIASGNPFTNDSLLWNNGWAHLITTQPGTYTPQWKQNTAGTYTSTVATFRGAVTTGGACDINQDGFVNVLDTQIAADMYLGLMPCTLGTGVCTATIANQIASASLGGNCAVSSSQGSGGGAVSHSVSLSWTPSASQSVTYNVYRGTSSGGPYSTKVASALAITSFTDSTVQSGKTYYYVATAVNSAGESGYSNQTQAIIPTP